MWCFYVFFVFEWAPALAITEGVEKKIEVINNALFKQGIGVALAVAAQLVVVLGGIVMHRFLGTWRLSQGGLGTLVFLVIFSEPQLFF